MYRLNTFKYSYLNLPGQHDGDDESVDGHGLAEDDGDEVLGLDPGRLNTSAQHAGAGGVDAEGGAHDAQGHAHADADGGPHVRRRL